MPEGVFPYTANPVGAKGDVTAIKRQLAVIRAALNWLIARHYVDRSRAAVVGHAARYDALFTSLQPVRQVSRLGKRKLFQWAGQDIFVSASIRKQFAAHAPHALVDLYPSADHQLTSTAQTDRDTFLKRELRLS